MLALWGRSDGVLLLAVLFICGAGLVALVLTAMLSRLRNRRSTPEYDDLPYPDLEPSMTAMTPTTSPTTPPTKTSPVHKTSPAKHAATKKPSPGKRAPSRTRPKPDKPPAED